MKASGRPLGGRRMIVSVQAAQSRHLRYGALLVGMIVTCVAASERNPAMLLRVPDAAISRLDHPA
jgi:hypothetical protein